MSPMSRQPSIRNQRNKGFKVKHVLQVCVIIAVSVWLIYQLKQSHHNNKSMEQTTSMLPIVADKSISGMFRFGRKDLDPSPVAATPTDGNMEAHSGNEDTGNKHADQLLKPQVQPPHNENIQEEGEEEEEEEAGDAGQELGHEEQLDHGDDSGDEEENEDKSDQHAKETEANTQVAREENYKGDDASSAVVRSDEEHTEIVDKDAEVHNESGVSTLMSNITSVNQTSLLEMEHEGDSTVNSTVPETSNPVEQEEEEQEQEQEEEEQEHEGDSTVNSTVPETSNPVEQEEEEQEQEQEEERKESNPNTSFVEKMEYEGDSTVNSTMPETSYPVEQEEEEEEEEKKEQEQEQEQEEEKKEQKQEQEEEEEEEEEEKEQEQKQEQEEEEKKDQEQEQEQEEEEKKEQESNPNTSFVEEMEHEGGGSVVDNNSTTTMSESSNSTLEKPSIADPTNSTTGRESGMEDGDSKSENIVIEQTVKSNAATTDDGAGAVGIERSESMSKDDTVVNEEEKDPKFPNGDAVEQVSNDATSTKGDTIVNENGGEHEPNESSNGDVIISGEEKDALTDLSTDEMKVEDISAE